MANDVIVCIPVWNGSRLEQTLATIPENIPREVLNNKELDWPLAKCWNYFLKKYKDDYKTIIISNDDVEFPQGSILAMGYTLYSLQYDRPGLEALIVTGYDPNVEGRKDLDMIWMPDRLGFACGMYCFCTSKKLVEVAGYFDEKFTPAMYEDTDMVYRVKLAGFEVYSCIPVYHHDGGGNTHKTDKERKQLMKDTRPGLEQYYIEKWGGLPWRETYTTPFDPESAGDPRYVREFESDNGIKADDVMFNIQTVPEEIMVDD